MYNNIGEHHLSDVNEDRLRAIHASYDKGRTIYALESMWYTPFILMIGFWFSRSHESHTLMLTLVMTFIFSSAFFALAKQRNWLAEGISLGVWFIFVPILIRFINPHDGATCTGHICMQACFTISLVVSFMAGIGLGGISEYMSGGDKKVMLSAFISGAAVASVGCLVVGFGAFSGLALGMLAGVATSSTIRPLLRVYRQN